MAMGNEEMINTHTEKFGSGGPWFPMMMHLQSGKTECLFYFKPLKETRYLIPVGRLCSGAVSDCIHSGGGRCG